MRDGFDKREKWWISLPKKKWIAIPSIAILVIAIFEYVFSVGGFIGQIMGKIADNKLFFLLLGSSETILILFIGTKIDNYLHDTSSGRWFKIHTIDSLRAISFPIFGVPIEYYFLDKSNNIQYHSKTIRSRPGKTRIIHINIFTYVKNRANNEYNDLELNMNIPGHEYTIECQVKNEKGEVGLKSKEWSPLFHPQRGFSRHIQTSHSIDLKSYNYPSEIRITPIKLIDY